MSAAIRSKSRRRRARAKLFPFLKWAQLVDRRVLRADFIAGLTGAIIVLPQGVAFALIAGLPPQYGLYTAIVTPVVAALFGSSRHMVTGPTTAISLVVLGVVGGLAAPGSPEYLPYVLTLTLLVGLFQCSLGLIRMGGLVNFISHTVVIGFTSGAAVLIAVNQFKHFFGVNIPSGESLFASFTEFSKQVGESNPYVILVASITLASALLIRYVRPRWPGMLIGIVSGSLACLWMDGPSHGVPLLGSLPAHLPPLSIPDFSIGTVRDLAPGALALAMIGLIEAVSIARSIATRSHQRIDGNQEFIGQGLANMVGSFFSCYAGSGSFTRSGINYEAGARTPLSAIFASLIVALVLVFLGPLTAYLPMPAMAGVIMLVAWNLLDIPHIRLILRTSKRDTVVLVVTFLATLFIALEFAIYVGVLLSLVLYLQRTSHPRIISLAPDPQRPKRYLNNAVKHDLPECPQLKIIRIDGSLFFGAVDHVQRSLYRLSEENVDWKHVLVIGDSINFIDVAGAEMLAQESQRLRRRGGGLYLCGIKAPVRRVLMRGGYGDIIQEQNFFPNKENAIKEIFPHLDPDRCRLCQWRIFRECATVEFEGSGLMS